VRVAVLLVFVLAAVAAGCGSSRHEAATSTPRETPANCRIHTVKQRVELRQLQADVGSMRRAAAPVKKRTWQGTPATQVATDRFIRHVDASRLPVFVKSRMIDHAAAAISPACESCFQQLEAGRPVGGGAKLAQSC
jgi:hypothetical protein